MEIIETPVFTNGILNLISDHEYRILQIELLFRPEAGKLIKGSGGLRKIRWKLPGGGKRGGIRVIYFYDPPDHIYMLFPYRKSELENLTQSQLNTLKKLTKEIL